MEGNLVGSEERAETLAEYLEKIDPLSSRNFQSILPGGMAERIQRKKGVADGRGSGGTRDFRASLTNFELVSG